METTTPNAIEMTAGWVGSTPPKPVIRHKKYNGKIREKYNEE
jgi:hypothetical protein